MYCSWCSVCTLVRDENKNRMLFSKAISTVLLPLLLIILVQTLSDGQVLPIRVPCNICGNDNLTISRYWGYVVSKNLMDQKIRRNCASIFYTWKWYGAPSEDICKFVQDGPLTKKNCGCVNKTTSY
jgi:hypothetical protein